MCALQSRLEEFEAALKSRASPDRVQVLRSVTDLFLEQAETYSEDQVDLFDDLFLRLVKHVEKQALAQLSRELAPVENAPIQMVRRLARHDDIIVSGPVLKQSKRLHTDDLIEIAGTKSQAHLLAIGRRPLLEEAVTDVLVDKGNAEVAMAITTNTGARFSSLGYSRLVARAEREEGLAELLAIRSETSPAHLRQLIAKATRTVRQRLMAVVRPEARGKIESVLIAIAADIDRVTRRRDYTGAQRRVLAMRQGDALMRATLFEAAEAGEFELTVVLLSVLASIPIPSVERILTNRDAGGLLLLCRALDLKWLTVRAMLHLHPVGDRATLTQLDRWLAQFTRIEPAAAERVVRFWRIRTTVASSDIVDDPQRDGDWTNWTVQ